MGKGEGSGSGGGEGQGDGSGDARGKTERIAVPAVPMPVAVLCCILNFLIPGLGTMIAGCAQFCCARNEDLASDSRVASCCIGLGIGLLQLITAVLFLIGWVWSCVWGVFFITMSVEYYHHNDPNAPEPISGGIVFQQTPVMVQPGVPQTTVVQQVPGAIQVSPGYYAGQYPSQPQGEPPPQYFEQYPPKNAQ